MVAYVHGMLELTGGTPAGEYLLFHAVVPTVPPFGVTCEVYIRAKYVPASEFSAIVSGTAYIDRDRRMLVIQCQHLARWKLPVIRQFVWLSMAGRVIQQDDNFAETGQLALRVTSTVLGSERDSVLVADASGVKLPESVGEHVLNERVQINAIPVKWKRSTLVFEVEDFAVM